MRILVTGANSQLGNELKTIVKSSSGIKDKFFFSSFSIGQELQLDICDEYAVRKFVAQEKISCIINCASYNKVNEAQANKDLAFKINVEAPNKLAIIMKEVDGLFVHFSSDYVLEGGVFNTPNDETVVGNPSGIYALSKLKAEMNIQNLGCKYLIFRTSWLYSEFGNNFVKTIVNRLKSDSNIKVVIDQVGSPTYAKDLAKVVLYIIENRLYIDKYGIYNYSNEGVCSWYDFAQYIADTIRATKCEAISEHTDDKCHYEEDKVRRSNPNNNGIATAIPRNDKIIPCRSNEYPSPVVRPSYSVLDKTKIKQTFGITIAHWTEGVQKVIPKIII